MRLYKSSDDLRSGYAHPPKEVQTVFRFLTGDEQQFISGDVPPNATVFGTLCPCGSLSFRIEDEDGVVSLVCELCGYRFLIYDRNKHQLIEHPAGTASPILQCNICAGDTFTCYLIYVYNDVSKVDDHQIHEDAPEDKYREFRLVTVCNTCRHKQQMIHAGV